jgi:hypothetical protein
MSVNQQQAQNLQDLQRNREPEPDMNSNLNQELNRPQAGPVPVA